jgi:hypothetical protein
LLNKEDEQGKRLLNDVYFGEYLDLIEEIENNLELKENNKNLDSENKDKTKNLISSEFYKFLVKNSRKRNKQYDNSMIFYNFLSLMMLSILTGGLIGIIFMIYYYFKLYDENTNLNNCL